MCSVTADTIDRGVLHRPSLRFVRVHERHHSTSPPLCLLPSLHITSPPHATTTTTTCGNKSRCCSALASASATQSSSLPAPETPPDLLFVAPRSPDIAPSHDRAVEMSNGSKAVSSTQSRIDHGELCTRGMSGGSQRRCQ